MASKELLDCPHIMAAFQQMRRERMTESMAHLELSPINIDIDYHSNSKDSISNNSEGAIPQIADRNGNR